MHIEEVRQYAESHIKICHEAGVWKTILFLGDPTLTRGREAVLEMLRGRPGILAGIHEEYKGCVVVEFLRRHTHI